ncbi:hypothetical protein [Sulfurisphaera javensis]|uniref:hypothetical protein n=1 Tax=Sulfurisphaera javensis TaxID=2049879 RepID=UPI0034E8FAE7
MYNDWFQYRNNLDFLNKYLDEADDNKAKEEIKMKILPLLESKDYKRVCVFKQMRKT